MIAATSCSGTGADKAGGHHPATPAVLTLANYSSAPNEAGPVRRRSLPSLARDAPDRDREPLARRPDEHRGEADSRRRGRSSRHGMGRKPCVGRLRDHELRHAPSAVPDRQLPARGSRARRRATDADAGTAPPPRARGDRDPAGRAATGGRSREALAAGWRLPWAPLRDDSVARGARHDAAPRREPRPVPEAHLGPRLRRVRLPDHLVRGQPLRRPGALHHDQPRLLAAPAGDLHERAGL